MAAAVLAMEHFNNRNGSVVPELANDFRDCNIQFDTSTSRVFNAGFVTHLASKTLEQQSVRPCAVAGPYSDIPALDLSAAAQAAEFPLVAYRAHNTRVVSDLFSPFSQQVFPDMRSSSDVMTKYLLHRERNYISLLYALTDTGSQRHETLSVSWDDAGIQWNAFPYFSPGLSEGDTDEVRNIRAQLEKVKSRGYRTIVVALENPFFEIPLIAEAANALEMNNGDYFWLWFDIFELSFLESEDAMIRSLLKGSAYVLPLESVQAYSGPFQESWSSQESDFVDSVNAANPIRSGEPGYVFAEADFFQTVLPEYGAAFMYDAVMSIGIGACLAESFNGTTSGADHVMGIRSGNFEGATGSVRFTGGARDESTVIWAGLNILPSVPVEGIPILVPDVYFPGSDGGWLSLSNFSFASGNTYPPYPLRDPGLENYLSNGVRIFGFVLLAVVLCAALMTAAWVHVHRSHRVLTAAQPYFLYLLSFGSAVEASAIITISFDESYGWSTEQLSEACMATPWLFCLGHIIIYGTHFTKLWRINEALQFRRRKIKIRHVA